ncbi:ABC transporter permease [Streptomyces sp. NBC_01077]|uniref:ABC transporter permease n=1 Tax=Streptomyces sp. NBC_01077 TaxID=2903746 RepID=UPI00386C0211|nr:ABC transporter permease [Streptomyces sp. NBC_01077]WSV44341.1 ABC transporter permease [Streptomyces sp. NBC_01077]
MLLVWQAMSSAGHIDGDFLPAPIDIARTGLGMMGDGMLYDAVLYSMTNTGIGFTIGAAGGALTGLAVALTRLVRVATGPLIYALWTVPKIALLPLFLIIFGFGAAPQICLIATSTYFLVLIPTIAAVASIPSSYRQAALCLGANRRQMVRHVLLPAALPQIFIALRLASGAAVLVMVAAEFTQGDQGVGFLIWNSWSLLLTERMYVGIVTVSILGVVFTQLVVMLGRRLTPWNEER